MALKQLTVAVTVAAVAITIAAVTVAVTVAAIATITAVAITAVAVTRTIATIASASALTVTVATILALTIATMRSATVATCSGGVTSGLVIAQQSTSFFRRVQDGLQFLGSDVRSRVRAAQAFELARKSPDVVARPSFELSKHRFKVGVVGISGRYL